MKKKLENLRCEVKEAIVNTLSLIYLRNNGCYPNWSNDEEIVIDNEELGSANYIGVEVGNTYDESYYIEKMVVEKYRVTCGGDLYLEYNEGCDEMAWEDVATDELVLMWQSIKRYWDKLQ